MGSAMNFSFVVSFAPSDPSRGLSRGLPRGLAAAPREPPPQSRFSSPKTTRSA